MKNIIPEFKDKDYEVLFVTGPKYFDLYKDIEVPKNVKMVPMLKDMLNVLKKTDLIITRAGASTIAEITAIGVPSVMIPSPYVTHNHQEKNAKVLEENKSAVVIKESELTSEKLLSTIDDIIYDENKLKKHEEELLSLFGEYIHTKFPSNAALGECVNQYVDLCGFINLNFLNRYTKQQP